MGGFEPGTPSPNTPSFAYFIKHLEAMIVHCQWEHETVRTGHPPSYAEAKKMKSLALHAALMWA